jgi:hypothetical protein
MSITKITTPELLDFPKDSTSSANTEGTVIPTGNAAAEPSSVISSAGEFRFNTTTSYVEYYNGSDWKQIGDEYITGQPSTCICSFPTSATTLFQLNSDGGVTNDVPNTCGGSNGTAIAGGGPGITYTTGKFGNAAVFTGGSYISVDNMDFPVNNYTISAWMNVDYIGASNPSTPYNMILATANSSSWFYFTIDGTQLYTYETAGAVAGGTVTAGTWHHCVLTKSSTAGTTLYLDGAVVGSNATFTSDNTGYSGGQNVLGAYDTGGVSYPYYGKMDQVRFFSSALSAAQVTELYNEVVCN